MLGTEQAYSTSFDEEGVGYFEGVGFAIVVLPLPLDGSNYHIGGGSAHETLDGMIGRFEWAFKVLDVSRYASGASVVNPKGC